MLTDRRTDMTKQTVAFQSVRKCFKKKASAVVNLRRLLNKADVLNGSQAEKSLFLSFIPSLFHFSVSNSDYTTNNQLDMICKKAVT